MGQPWLWSVHSVFSLKLFPPHSFPLFQHRVFMGYGSFRNIHLLCHRCSTGCSGAVDTCSTMEHLLFLLTLVLPLPFPPLFLSRLLPLPLSIQHFLPFIKCSHKGVTRLTGSAASCGVFTRTSHAWHRQSLASSQRPPLQLPCYQRLATRTPHSFLRLLASRSPFSMKAFTEI